MRIVCRIMGHNYQPAPFNPDDLSLVFRCPRCGATTSTADEAIRGSSPAPLIVSCVLAIAAILILAAIL